MPGKLYLVGAGPGDPGLLTIKGKRCIELADVIIYDYLANPRLLDYARQGTLRILAGKHGGGPHVEQSEINRLIVEHARHDRIVVRLKGGDPFIFGRGAEEADVAQGAGIPFEIVPGVTSAIAVPAYAGIPLTYRDLASNVIFTTGYEYTMKPAPAVHWSELARTGSTLVILMTQRQLRTNMNSLLDAGLAADTPAAVIEWGTRAAQRTITGTVGSIGAVAERAGVKPPAIAVVGAVVQLRDRLNWFERKPLFGRRIVITRPRAQAMDFAAQLETWGAEVIPFATIETVPPASFDPIDDAIRRATEFDWVIFTSANGVRVFFDRVRSVGADIRDWKPARFAAIGPQTAKAIEASCVRVAVMADEYRAEGIIAALSNVGIEGQRVLLPRAAGARTVLPTELRRLGAIVEEVATYRTVPPGDVEDVRALLTERGLDLITFTSSSSVHNFVAALGAHLDEVTAHAEIGCIGPITAETARSYGLGVAVQPQTYTIPAFVAAIAQHYTQRPDDAAVP